MALVQLRFLPRYIRLSFSPGFWAFTFAYAAATTDTLDWITARKPPAAAACAVALLTALSVLIAAIAARTLVAVRRGQFFPAPQPTAVAGREREAQAPRAPVGV
jgi:tellurite resistance protein